MPQVRADLGASETMLELVIAGYGIPFAVLLILGGRLGDRFGRHAMFAAGMVLFLLSALACSFAPSIETLIAARIAQGLARPPDGGRSSGWLSSWGLGFSS